MDPHVSTANLEERQLAARLQQARDAILGEIRKLIIGQDDTIELVLIALFTGGHCLITGVPGLAKTLLIRTLAKILDLDFKRIQFTPDLMPADITGIDVIEEDRTSGKRVLKFIKGPLFANIILADEINRTPPKTQAALLEAMQEHHITAGGVTYRLEEPFFVLATQNPIELEGTYPLPEAQLDRFMFNLVMDYLPEEQEVEVATATTGNRNPVLQQVVRGEDVLAFQALVRKVFISQEVARYAVQLVRATRPTTPTAPDFVKNWVTWGAGLRASQYLVLGGKARALLHGRVNVSVKDIQALALPVLRHRVLTNFFAESEKVKAEDIIRRLLEIVPPPKSGL
ncbi:MAG: AAA family ATPase [candidate division KSB1 bacterium]|nr:AAA family ATPase [candidate division KSB1 bacterium]MDZ7272864.1 AAA family ATPase [candidate division KSB1 bacterium]MDZ7284113.1 AAA family ATPase [candidate division KSB1 bacterium]MDZ7297489.1 AAA family ATPase [candidate division KSB1 bacterium]MDZ7305625.1 AAA family ATPase [candidate division KSB1 bacterium]